MSRTKVVSLLFCAVLASLAASAIASTPRPNQMIRIDGQAVWANSKIHWIGGRSDWYPDGSGTYFGGSSAGHSIYNPSNNTWASSEYDRTDPRGIDLNGDGHIFGNIRLHSSSELDTGISDASSQTFTCDYDNDGTEEILIHGGSGSTGDGGFTCYDPANNSWTKTGALTQWTGLPQGAECGFNQINGIAVAYNNSAYCYGGLDWGCYDVHEYAAFAKYSFASHQWTTLPRGPVSVVNGAGAVVGKYLYLVGGQQLPQGGSWSAYATAIWRCDLDTGSWSSAPVGNLLLGVQKPAIGVYNGKIYVIGGYKAWDGSTDGSSYIQEFNTANGNIAIVATIPTPLRGCGAAISPTGVIYFGGGLQGSLSGLPSTTWWKTTIGSYSFPQIASDPASFPYEDWLLGCSIEGQVTAPDGSAVANAMVGLKTGSQATADALKYATTDAQGNYFFGMLLPGDYCIAAAKEGIFTPTYDVPVHLVDGSDQNVNLAFGQFEGTNVAAGKPVGASTGSPSLVTDGDLSTLWASGQQPGEPECVYIDIRRNGQPQVIDGITIYWASGRASSYQVDTMSEGEPLSATEWEYPAIGVTVATQYQAIESYNGYPAGLEGTVCPIRFTAPVSATGIRIKMDQWFGWAPYYGICEVQAHSNSTFTTGIVHGIIKDSSGDPIYNAVVQMDAPTGPAVVTDPSGAYSFVTETGGHHLSADAIKFSPKAIELTANDTGYTTYDIALNAREEAGVYNGDFELMGNNAGEPDGWEIKVESGYATSQYSCSRSSVYNATPGGEACGRIHTAVALNPPFIDEGDRTHYWTAGWLTPVASKRLAVNPAHSYNFYFKARGGDSYSYLNWGLVWLRADGSEIAGHAIDILQYQCPRPGSWTQVIEGAFEEDSWARHNMLAMSPPADAAFAEIRLGLMAHPYDQPVRDDEIYFDDVVFDDIPPATISGRVLDYDGSPVTGAVVGLKASPKATADALEYTTTDIDGRYSFSCSNGTYYVAAWNEGRSPSEDENVVASGEMSLPDITLEWDGVNVAAGHPERVAASDSYEGAAGCAVDESLGSEWRTARYTNDAYYYVDLGNPTDIRDITTYRYIQWNDNGNSADDMTIDAMTSGNPLDPTAWDNSANGISTVYSVMNSVHGFERQTEIAVNSIRTDLTGVRGIRLHFQNPHWPPYLSLKEIQIHNSASRMPAVITGKVLDRESYPVQNAIVGVKKSPKATCDTETYLVTDENGNYSFAGYTADTYYFAAWKQGYYPTDDQVVSLTNTSGTVPDLVLQTNTGENLIAYKGSCVGASDYGIGDPSLATDGQIIDFYGTYGWGSSWGGGWPQYYYVDLGKPTAIKSILMYRFLERNDDGDSRDDYELYTMQNGNPLDPASWESPTAGVTRVYGAYGTIHGYEVQPQLALNALNLQLDGVRGLRFKFSSPHRPPYFDFRELEVYGAARSQITISGKVVDDGGSGVEGAFVGFKNEPMASAGAQNYVVTDVNGNYTFTGWANTDYYVAAWKQGTCPSADSQVRFTGEPAIVPTLQLTATGDNLILNKPSQVAASEEGLGTADKAVDGIITGNAESGWCTNDWLAQDEWPYYYIKVDDAGKPVKDIVIYRWFELNDQGNSMDDYTVDIMTAGTDDPLGAASWNNSANGISTIYSVFNTLHGCQVLPSIVGDAIRVDAPNVRGIRIHFRNAHCPRHYEMHEVQVHGNPGRITVARLGNLKFLSDTTKISISGKEITAIPDYFGVPANTAFIEEADRSAGIRLDVSGVNMSDMYAGVQVDVDGQVMSTSQGEKYILVESLNYAGTTETPILPVGMNIKSAENRLAQGMRVKIWGRPLENRGDADYYLDDGSGTPIHVYCYYGTMPPAGHLIGVDGVISVEEGNTVLYQTTLFTEDLGG